ncbi:hypothetical protein N9V13_03025 [Betaproteobacteria bacterium]|nr:hypothetical protein [Betaproteobacteria bacterium]
MMKFEDFNQIMDDIGEEESCWYDMYDMEVVLVSYKNRERITVGNLYHIKEIKVNKEEKKIFLTF